MVSFSNPQFAIGKAARVMLTQVRCRWLPEHGGEERLVSVGACRACALSGTNPCKLPLPIILHATNDRNPAVVRASATMLDGCAREQALKANHEWAINPERAYTRSYGSLVHGGAEVVVSLARCSDQVPEGQVTEEQRYRRPYVLPDGRTATVTAQLDLLFKLPDGTYAIEDYKAVASLGNATLTRKVEHYIPQFSIQRWILAGMGWEVSRIDLHFLTQTKPRRVNLYPDGDAEIPSARLMSLEEVELYFDERLPALFDGLEGGVLPPPLTERDELWRCRYCDVASLCQELADGPVPGLA